MSPEQELWPDLPYGAWKATRDTLHRYCQIVGKIRLGLAPRRNHWWHVPLYVTPRGLTTGTLPAGDRYLALNFDLLDLRLAIETSIGETRSFPLLDGLSVAAFYHHLTDTLRALGIQVPIRPYPFALDDDRPFVEDDRHSDLDVGAVQRFHRALLVCDELLGRFAGGFVGKASPVHFFWHSFDLAYTRFSGRRAPARDGADGVSREAYSHECISFGWWPGDELRPFPAFYAYTVPEPGDLTSRPLAPAAARWETRENGSLALLAWDDARASADPAATVQTFLQSAYEACADATRWDREALDLFEPVS